MPLIVRVFPSSLYRVAGNFFYLALLTLSTENFCSKLPNLVNDKLGAALRVCTLGKHDQVSVSTVVKTPFDALQT